MRLFIFLFLTVTSLSIAKAQSTGCPSLSEDSTIHDISLQCSSHGPRISIGYGSIYFDTARDDYEVLLLLLRVQRTQKDRYTPDEMRNLIEYLVLNVSRQLLEGFRLWNRILPEEIGEKMLEMYAEFNERFTIIERIDGGSPYFVLSLPRHFSQSKLDELHDWLVSNKIGNFEALDPLANDCPITGDLRPLLESTQECAVWNSAE